MYNDGTKGEKTGFRDEALSLRHRSYGFNCPAVDIDLLMIEYDLAAPVGLVEFKYHLMKNIDLAHPTYRAIAELCSGYRNAPLPFFLSRYWDNPWMFEVTPVNDAARRVVRHDKTMMDEVNWVTLLYYLRRRPVPADVLKRLDAA